MKTLTQFTNTGYKGYALDVVPHTGECLTLHRHNRGPREDFATVYTITSPRKGVLVQVRINDYQHYGFMAY